MVGAILLGVALILIGGWWLIDRTLTWLERQLDETSGD